MINGIGIHIGMQWGISGAALAKTFINRVQEDGGVVESEDCLAQRIDTLHNLGLWDKASAVWFPHGYKEGKLYAVKGGAGADFGFTRGGTRTRKAATYVEGVPYNLLSRSEEFDNAVWVKDATTGSTASANLINNPLTGILTADKLNEDGSNGLHYTYQTQTSVAGSRYTTSIYAKAGERSIVWLYGHTAATATAYFNLTTGVVGTVSGSGTPLASIESLGNGWYRCVLTYTPSATTSASGFGVTTTDGVNSYIGTVGNGAYFFGAQHVAGTSARDYFATTNRQNVPTLDYTGSTCPALSLEPARTNLLLQSEAFETASWTKTNETVTANAAAGPNNLSTADAMFETATANALHNTSQSVSKAASALKYTLSISVKPNGRDWVRLTLSSGSNGAGKRFNITTGAIGSTNIDGIGWTLDDWHIVQEANGFYRVDITVTSDTATSIATNVVLGAADGTESYTGDVTKGVYLYGAQLEQASYTSSYIPTTTATVSRIADAVTMLYPQGTNQVLQSQTFDNATWIKSDASVVVNAINDPNGTLTADKINTSTANAFHGIYQNPGIDFTEGVIYTISVYAKAGEYSYLRLGFPGVAIPNTVTYFNLTNGVIGTKLAGVIAATMTDEGDGWYRCSMTGKAVNNVNSGLSLIYVSQSDNQGSYIGSATSGIYVWGAQLEKGSTVTTYKPTTTTPVHDGSVIGQTEGTLYFEGSSFADGVGKIFLECHDNSTNNRITIFQDQTTNLIKGRVTAAGVIQADITSASALVSGTNYKIVLTYKGNKAALTINGTKAGEDLTVTVPATSVVDLDTSAESNPFYGNGEAWAISKIAISDAEAIALTQI